MSKITLLPNISELTETEAISWYTKEVAKVFSKENRINGIYSDEYKDALLEWKKKLNKSLRH